MRDKKLRKRILSFGLSILLVLGLAIGHLPGGIFYEWFMASNYDFSLEKSERALGANVIPSQMKDNTGFMSKYIYTTNSSALNLNSYFKLYNWKNIDKDVSMSNGNSLTRAKLMHQKNKAWEANYKWSLTDAQYSLMQNYNYVLTYEGNLFADEHYNLTTNANDHWDVGTAWLYAGKNGGETGDAMVWKLAAEKKNDEKAQAVKREQGSISINWSSYEQALFFRAEHDGCACGSSGVSNSVFYMYDKSAPYVKNVYISRNSDGSGELNSGDGFVANEKGYVVLEFNENIRFSDNSGYAVNNDRLVLNLDAYYRKNNVGVDDAIIYAKMFSLEGNKMVFEFSVPEKTGSENTDVYINGISSTQSFVNSSSGFPLIIYKGDGSEGVGTSAGYTVKNYITDIAGNPLNWEGSDKTTDTIYLDNVKPTMTNISMFGSMINGNSTTSKGSWPTDLDRSSVFAGVGDTIGFEVSFSENVTNYTKENVKAVLNLLDADGNPIELSLDRNWGNHFKFQSLTITDSMKVEKYGNPIVITGFKGLTNLEDVLGNKMVDTLLNVTMKSAQQIYLDVDAPMISTTCTWDESATAYTPDANEVGEYFTFPIVLKENLEKTTIDNTSTISGRDAYFSLLMNGAKDFEWYVDTNPEIDKDSEWKTGSTAMSKEDASRCNFTQIDGVTMYLHIKLNPNTDYDYATNLVNQGKVCFVGSIYVHSQDYAGNTEEAQYAIQHDVDKVSPTGTISEQANLVVDYNNLEGTLSADIKIDDNYALKTLKYYWTYTPDGGVTDVTETTTITIPKEEMLKEKKASTSYTFSFDKEGNAGRKGEAFLTIVFEDYNGGTGTLTGPMYTYDFTKSIPNYTIKTGSQVEPLYLPEVKISAPESTGESSEQNTTRTIMAFPYGTETVEGVLYTKYYIWDPLDWRFSGGGLEYTSEDIFQELKENGPYGYNSESGNYIWEKNGVWAEVVGTLSENGEIKSETTVNDVDAVYDFISTYYGELEVLFITSSEFAQNYSEFATTADMGYEYSEAQSTVESYTVYLMNGGTFSTSLDTVQRDGKDAIPELNYDFTSGNRPAQNIDNVALTLSIQNTKDANYTIMYTDEISTENTNKGYGFIPFLSGTATLYYSGHTQGTRTESVYTWSLDAVSTQTIVIPEDVAKKTGWYCVEVILDTVDGEPTYTYFTEYFFMDAHVSDIMIDSYYKDYEHSESGRTLTAKNLTELSGETYFEVALDTAPNGWTTNSYITFGRTERDDYSYTGLKKDEFTEMVTMRVYNKADENYEANAIWVDVSGKSEDDHVYYAPVEVADFTTNQYGTAESLQLPLLSGENLICYEIIGTNGVKTAHEIAVYAHTEAIPLELDVEYTKISPRTGGIMEFAVSPVQTVDMDLANSIFNLIHKGHGYADSTSYTFDEDMDCEFYLLDHNGNLSTAWCKVTDVDGDAPAWSRLYKEENNGTYCLEVSLYDHEGTISADEITLTLDADYSALLMGLTGDARTQNTEQISFKVPFNLEKDEQGNYLPWESYTDACYGIYSTQIIEYGPDETHAGNIYFKMWGTCRAEPVDADGNQLNESKGKIFTFSAMDANGNETTNQVEIGAIAYNQPRLETGVYVGDTGWGDFDIDKELDENGYIGIYFDRQLKEVNGYGAGELKEGYSLGQQEQLFYTTAPLITKDGIYYFEITDLFGDTYTKTLDITGDNAVFGTLGIDVSFSETNKTNKDITVTAEAMLENDFITSITAVGESGTIYEGVILENIPTTAMITLPENAKVTIKTDQSERIVTVTNIDKSLEPASVIFEDSLGMEINTTEDTLYEKVTARVVCDELLYGTNGQLNYQFSIGSKKGDTYTFEYSDRAGNTGSITAVLPYNLESDIQETPVDDRSPDFTMGVYGLRNAAYSFIANIANPCDEMTETGVVDNSDSTEIYNTLANYIAQAYKLVLDVEDESKVKILIQEGGTEAPVSYADVTAGSTVEGVSLSGTTITITENTTFDLYAIDEMNNVTALTNIVVDSIDNEALALDVIYEVDENDNGETIVIATFEPANPLEKLAQIIALDDDVLSKWMSVDVYDEAKDDLVQKAVLRYYYILTANGSYEFTYKDEYGNIGQTTATVKGMNNSPAIVNSEMWFGTTMHTTPAQSEMVNKDVIAALKMSKAVSDVKLYVYQQGTSSTLDKTYLGDELSTSAPVELSFTSNNVYVTYTDNVDYQIIAEFTAAENGKKGYYVLPAVTCIDKKAPVVAEQQPELSKDKRSLTFTFTTNEPALFNKGGSLEYATEFVWIAKTNVAQELLFTDKAGNVTKYQITEDMLADIDAKYLSVSFCASADGTEETNNPVADLNLAAGKDMYVKVNKEAVAYVDDTELGTFVADTWTKLTLPQEAGLHVLKLVDVNTEEVLYKTIAASQKDNVAPVITFDVNTIALDDTVTMAELETAIHSGVTITDNVDGDITEYTITGQPSTVKCGLYELTYTSVDAAGNKVTKLRNLYIMQEGTPVIKINGESAVPYGTIIVKGFDVKLEVEGLDEELLLVKYKSGIKTVGQMKYGTTTVDNMQFTVSEEGFYTIYIRTQDRIECITQIYVEE